MQLKGILNYNFKYFIVGCCIRFYGKKIYKHSTEQCVLYSTNAVAEGGGGDNGT